MALSCRSFLKKLFVSKFKAVFLPTTRTMTAGVQNGLLVDTSHVRSVKNDIIKSFSDERLYRGLQLTNGMKVMLISDVNTDKAAAAMNVNIGSMCDPEDLPGLAHFCEHMLFLGTKKYPDEAEYQKFIQQHAGSCNAFTSSEHTTYYFDIGHEHLREILDRFAQFFHSPLFDKNCTDREVNAVNSEHEKNLMSDAWRMHQLDKSTSDPNHKYSRFSTGNKDTLDIIPKSNGISVRDELLKFHDAYYSSNVMSLAVLGKNTLDELERMVLDLFVGIKNKNVEPLKFDSSPYRPQDLQKYLQVVPIKDVRNLLLTFPIPDCREWYKSHPISYLGHLIGHEGPGSLLSELKNQGWVNALSAGGQAGANGYEFFIIQVDLTEDGMEHVNDIVTCMFQYIDMLRSEEPLEWIFTEIKELNALNFRFKDKQRPTSCVLKLSQSMHYYPLEDAISAEILLSDFKPHLITTILNKLVPSNVRLSVIAKSFEETANESEKWYGTKYRLEAISSEVIDSWTNVKPNPKFYLPMRNEFIPTNFEISPLVSKESNFPAMVKSSGLSQVWFKQDNKFYLPKACLMFELFSPIAYISPQYSNMVYMFTELFKDSLNEYAYAAELAGLKYGLKNSIYGLQVEVNGYNDKQIVLLEKIFTKMATFKVDPKRFEIIKELFLRALKNFEAEQSYAQATYYTHVLKSEKSWLKSEHYEALPSLTCEQLQDFVGEFMSRLHVELLVHGNLLKADALKISNMVEEILTNKASTYPLVESQLTKYRDVCIPNGSSYVYQYHNPVRDISAVDLFLQVGQQNIHDNVLLQLLVQIIQEPCFTVLRTKENLGYIVSSGLVRSNGVHGLRVIVQSEHSPHYLEQRIEAFINHVEKLLKGMDDAEFNRHVAALSARILEKPKRLTTESIKHWTEISSHQYNFNRAETEAEHLKTITKLDVVNFYNEFIHVDAAKRSKLVVHVLAKSLNECPTSPEAVQSERNEDLYECPSLPKSIVIKDIDEFKNSLELYPRIAPYIDVVAAKLASAL